MSDNYESFEDVPQDVREDLELEPGEVPPLKREGADIPPSVAELDRAKRESIRDAIKYSSHLTNGRGTGTAKGAAELLKYQRELAEREQKEEDKKDIDKNDNAFKEWILEYANRIKEDRKLLPAKEIRKLEFWDALKTKPKRGLLVLAGETEAGKTAHSLSFLADVLKGDNPPTVAITEDSELNEEERLGQWIEDKKLDKKNIDLCSFRKDVIKHFKPGRIILINDACQWLGIRKSTDKKEVGDILEALSWLAQQIGFLIILNHDQTKTSRGEKDVKYRSGGAAVWVNKPRYSQIIEIGKTGEAKTFGNELGETRVEEPEKPFITLQKGRRPGHKPRESYWLNSDYSIGEKISSDQVREMINEKVTGQDSSGRLGEVVKIIEDYKRELQTDRIPTETFYELCKKLMGIKSDGAEYHLKKLKQYKKHTPGFGAKKESFIVSS